MNFEEARQQVEEYVNKNWIASGHATSHGPLIVVKHIEKPYGWIFFYTAKKYWETRDIQHAVAGSGPIIFVRTTGSMHQLGTATPHEEQRAFWGTRVDYVTATSGLGLKPDGVDVGGPRLSGHRTIYPTVAMSPREFIAKWFGLNWVKAGTKKQ